VLGAECWVLGAMADVPYEIAQQRLAAFVGIDAAQVEHEWVGDGQAFQHLWADT
jgi:hypothetical protein